MNQILSALALCLSLMQSGGNSICTDAAEFASATFLEATGYLPPEDTNKEELRDAKLQVRCLLNRKLGFPKTGLVECDPVHDAPLEVLYIASHLILLGEKAFFEGKYQQFLGEVEVVRAQSEEVLSLSAR